ncbi:hypothetical protein BH11PSE10_BH11PSE10_12220 [soil metagenome]
MIPPGTAREMVLLEALGDVAALVDRVEALLPAMEKSRTALIRSREDLDRQLKAFESRMTTIAENAKMVTVQHIAKVTDDRTRVSLKVHLGAIEEAARTALGTEIRPTLHALIAPIQHLADLAHRRDGPWERWLIPLVAVTASTAASAATWLVALHLGRA